jgi:hypothetical protein
MTVGFPGIVGDGMNGRNEINFKGSRYPIGVQLKSILTSLALDNLTFFQTLELHILGRTLVYCEDDDAQGVIWLCKEGDAYCFSFRRLTTMDFDRYGGATA